MRFQLQIVVSLVVVAGAQSLRAGIIIDDFDVAMNMVLPEMENQSVMTPAIGTLNADRFIDVSSSQTDPIGGLDVAVSRPSHLTARIDGQFLDNPLNLPILSFGTGYVFDTPADLTEGGLSSAVFIDMRRFQGTGIPPALSVAIRDANDVFAAIVPGASLRSDSPYTVVVPFSSFGFRGGGGVGLADFSTIDLLEVRVRLLQGGRDSDVNWLVELDRIRVGQLVPEPTAWRLAILTALLIGGISVRRQQ
jgi:hypothetical protein